MNKNSKRPNQKYEERYQGVNVNPEINNDFDLEISEEYLNPYGFADPITLVNRNGKTDIKKKTSKVSKKTK